MLLLTLIMSSARRSVIDSDVGSDTREVMGDVDFVEWRRP